MRLFLIRHAETDYNSRFLLQGDLDSELTQEGLRQVMLTAKELGKEAIDLVFSSTAKRAYDTARPIALPRRLPVVMVPDLRERAYGIYEGKSLMEAKKEHPEFFTSASVIDFDAKPEDGESLKQVADRVLHFLKRLTENFPDRTVVIVSHGVVNKIMIGQLLDGSLDKIGDYKEANCCINELLLEDGKAKAVRLNYTGHLKENGVE